MMTNKILAGKMRNQTHNYIIDESSHLACLLEHVKLRKLKATINNDQDGFYNCQTGSNLRKRRQTILHTKRMKRHVERLSERVRGRTSERTERKPTVTVTSSPLQRRGLT